MTSMKSNMKRFVAVAASVTMIAGVAACGETNNTSGTAANTDCSAYKQYGDLKGKKITVYTPWIDSEGDATAKAFESFETCTGATVEHEGTKDMAAQLPVRVKAGSAPDIAIVAQPGWIKSFVDQGKVIAPSDEAAANVDKYYSQDWKDYASIDGTLWAVPTDASAKSFVWYSPKLFKEKGYEVPKTWDEMLDLTKKIAKDNAGDQNVKPWAAGIEDGGATGWVATDWVEDAVLRFAGGDTYNKWVDHEIPFNDPAIVDALEKVGEILKNNDYVNGGFGDSQSIATTAWQDAGMSLTDGSAYMMRQALFYQSNFEGMDAGIDVSEDGDVWAFPLPGKSETDKAMTGGGDFALAFADRPEVAAFQAWLGSPEYANARAAALSGWVTANTGLDSSKLKPIDKLAYDALTDKNTTFRFDGSDLMPNEVGSGSFWKQMVAYFAQDKSETEVLDAIEASWPQS